MLLVACLPIKLLLRIHLTSLHASRASINMRLPSRRTKKPDAPWRGVIEDLFDFFKRLLRGFWEEEEHVQEHGHAEDAEDDVDFPADVGECGGHEVGEGEVECPKRS